MVSAVVVIVDGLVSLLLSKLSLHKVGVDLVVGKSLDVADIPFMRPPPLVVVIVAVASLAAIAQVVVPLLVVVVVVAVIMLLSFEVVGIIVVGFFILPFCCCSILKNKEGKIYFQLVIVTKVC